MTDGENQSIGTYVETSAGGERVRAYVPAPLPPNPPLELGRFMQVYERAITAVGRLDGMTTILPSTPLFLYMYVRKEDPSTADRRLRPSGAVGAASPRIAASQPSRHHPDCLCEARRRLPDRRYGTE